MHGHLNIKKFYYIYCLFIGSMYVPQNVNWVTRHCHISCTVMSDVKIMTPLCIIKNRPLPHFRGVGWGVYLPKLLISTLDVGERSASLTGCVIPGETILSTDVVVGRWSPRVGLDNQEKKNSLVFAWGSTAVLGISNLYFKLYSKRMTVALWNLFSDISHGSYLLTRVV